MIIGEEEIPNERALLTQEDGPMMASSASVKYIVIHCSATRSTRDYTAEQLLRDHKTRGFRIAQLHISAGSTCYEINKERQPVGRLVKQQYRRHFLPKISKNQRKRREKSSKHTGVQAVYSADKHYESQPEINHLELRVCVGKLYQKFRDPRCQQDLEELQQPDLMTQSIDYPVEQRLFRRLAFLPYLIDLRQVVQQTIALKPPIPVAYHIVVCRIRLERIGTIGHFQCRA